ncbi:MAG: xanthine dehydrogenase accessory protein XdhC [Bacteriovoracaceae bacterium]|jgi:xanthine dehydrogenase accessory factor|nr:xanthine dehydrogenase accessory protein XdhC [Bacteriovoracaceae bacterium]
MSYQFLNFTKEFQSLLDQDKSFVTITLTDIIGSAPQDLGARIIVSKDKIEFGTIGGGKIENAAIEHARKMLEDENSLNKDSRTWNLQKDIGMTCGGKVSLLFEKFQTTTDWNIVIFGAGHVSQELTRNLLRQNCRITVVDSRQEWIEKLPVHEKLKVKLVDEPLIFVKDIPKKSYVILMTMGSGTDLPILHEILKTNKETEYNYLGMIGSKSKRNNIEKELRQRQIHESKFGSFICPIGEDIGGNSPAEISISIIAQMLKNK